ncbi:hypothetical protein BU26DRAFT_506749 [Trematosphaeria pertusa]|uniref:Uncharacterized protein n=1 Tax=Trematosphaeria pertusa TaxID=390896 RepID=A0A6A6IDD9_9PLEO|nr:uncharacterized protein BU26DRAFT_506749 [Trematosphaeria pertusa]KAF2247523.1 hypothetical protein BU26DRAFT_506749 [Trematosphaeria pertusa]
MMLIAAIFILVLGLMLGNAEAIHTIAGVPMAMIRNVCLGVWTCFTALLFAISLYNANGHAIYALGHLVAIFVVLGFFASYLRFEPTSLHVWGPLAVDLGIVLSVGTRAAYTGADRGILRDLLDFLLGYPPHRGGEDNSVNNGHELNTLLPQPRHAPRGEQNV